MKYNQTKQCGHLERMLSEKKQILEYSVQSFICINLKKAKQSNILNMLICDKIVFISNGMINTKFKNVISSPKK